MLVGAYHSPGSYHSSGSSNSIGSSTWLTSPSIEGGKSQGQGDGNMCHPFVSFFLKIPHTGGDSRPATLKTRDGTLLDTQHPPNEHKVLDHPQLSSQTADTTTPSHTLQMQNDRVLNTDDKYLPPLLKQRWPPGGPWCQSQKSPLQLACYRWQLHLANGRLRGSVSRG
jgi:hypothetical protein